MAAANKEVELIVALIKTTSKANDDAHGDIARRIDDLGSGVAKTLDGLAAYCLERESAVNSALESLQPKKYTAWQSARGLAKLSALSLTEAGIVVGLLKAFGVLE
jgi:hypothetical protein